MDARIQRLTQRRDDAAALRKAIVDRVEARGAEHLSESEDDQFRRLSEEILSYDERIAELTEEAEREQQATEGAAALVRAAGPQTSRLPLPCDVGSEELRALHAAARSQTARRVEARTVSGIAGTALNTNLSHAAYRNLPRVANLFSVQNTESPVVRTYATTTAATAGTVAEGAPKPDAGIALTPVDVAMTKIATFTKLTLELIDDYNAFVQAIGMELTRAVVAEENAEMVSTLLSAALRAQANTGADGIDATGQAIATLMGQGITPDAIVMSPGRLAAIRAVKATTGGDYVIDPQTAAPSGLHGLPITVAPQLTDTSVLVGNFHEAGVVYVRERVSLRTGVDSDDFTKNLVTLIAEERIALAVTQPARIVHIDLT